MTPLVFYPATDLSPDLSSIRSAAHNSGWRPTVVALVRRRSRKGHLKFLAILQRRTFRRKLQILWRRLAAGLWPGRNKFTDLFRERCTADLVKGGVDADDATVDDALLRELAEEVRLDASEIISQEFLGCTAVPFDIDNAGRDGYSEGKLYIIFLVRIGSKKVVSLAPEENVVGHIWERDLWEAFPKGSKKRTIFEDPRLREVAGMPPL
ncbi:MAG: NUDIX domain-containing protein [Bacteroidota bacterium]